MATVHPAEGGMRHVVTKVVVVVVTPSSSFEGMVSQATHTPDSSLHFLELSLLKSGGIRNGNPTMPPLASSRSCELGQVELGPLGDIFTGCLDSALMDLNSYTNLGRISSLLCPELAFFFTNMVGPVLQIANSQPHEP